MGRIDRIKRSHGEGKLGFGFSAGGFLFAYHLGFLYELVSLGILPHASEPSETRRDALPLLSGSSAGSLAVATYASGITLAKATSALKDFAQECRQKGTMGRMGPLLRDFLGSYLPSDAHERCSNQISIHVTTSPSWSEMTRGFKEEDITQFDTKEDLVEALMSSCHIPLYLDGRLSTKVKGKAFVDGGISAFVPSPSAASEVVKVCCFPTRALISRLSLFPISTALAKQIEIDCSPDTFEPYNVPYRKLVTWALLPAPDEVLDGLIEKGQRDARSWANSVDLIGSK